MDLLRSLFSRLGQPRQPRKTVRLKLEALEERRVLTSTSVVPLTQAIDNVSTFHRLQDALRISYSSGDSIIIEPGANADLAPVLVNNSGITITGDANIPASILPAYDLTVNAANVTLTHLNLGTVTLDPDFKNDAITRSTVNTINVIGGASGVGNTVIDQNFITGSVSVMGMAGSPMLNVRITNNTIHSLVPSSTSPLINVQDATNAVVQNNTLVGGGPAAQIGIQFTRGVNNLIANNSVTLPGGDLGTSAIVVQNPGQHPLTSITIRNNTLATGQGRGLYINAFDGLNMLALVQGNDFHNNAIGVAYLGDNSASIAADLGGGSNSQGNSLGGNDFHGYPRIGTPDHTAILLSNVAAGAILPAKFNIFDDGSFPNNVVTSSPAGTIDVSQALGVNRAFVQTLYNNMLGRTGTLGELDSWGASLSGNGSAGQTAVVSGILRSDESLNRLVGQYYLQYLGRAADAAGQIYWVSQVKAGMTFEALQANFVSSQEFIANNNSDYIQGLFRTMLGRTGSSAELAYWYAKLPTLGLSGIATAFSTTQENHIGLITGFFTTFLHRAPAAGDMLYWSVQPGDLLTVEAKLLSSGEYYVRG